MKSKKAVMGEGILMVYRLVLVSVIAVVILGLSAVFYDYYIDARPAEARILTRQVVNCIAPEGVVFLDDLPEENFLSDYCKIKYTERFFVNVSFFDENNLVGRVIHGDSSRRWVKEIFDRGGTENIRKYEPGYFVSNYNVSLIKQQEKFDRKMVIEVVVSHGF